MRAFAYLVHRVLADFVQRTGARVTYVPVLLGGRFKLAKNRSPMQAFAEMPAKLAFERLELQHFVARDRFEQIRFNPHFPINTLALIRGAVDAQRLG